MNAERAKALLVSVLGFLLLFGVLFAVFASMLSGVVEIVVFTAFVVIGVGVVPGVVYILGDLTPGSGGIGKLLWTVAALTYGNTIIELDRGRYVPRVARTVGDRVEYFKEGTWIELDGATKTLAKVGTRPLGFTWSKSPDQRREVEATQLEGQGVADGGEYELLDQERGGYRLFNPHQDEDGIIVDMVRIWERLSGSAEGVLLEKAKQEALQSEAASSRYGAVLLYVSVFVALLSGFIGMIWVMG